MTAISSEQPEELTGHDASGPGTAGSRKVVRTGVVDSISGRKTVRVVVNNLTPHPLYGKYVRRRTRLLAHDANSQARIGDTVELAPSRPISKRKAWRLVRVIKSAAGSAHEGGDEGDASRSEAYGVRQK